MEGDLEGDLEVDLEKIGRGNLGVEGLGRLDYSGLLWTTLGYSGLL